MNHKIINIVLVFVLSACTKQTSIETLSLSNSEKHIQKNAEPSQHLPNKQMELRAKSATSHTLVLETGDTITSILKSFGINEHQVYHLRKAMLGKIDINQLLVGTAIDIEYDEHEVSLKVAYEYGKLLIATWQDDIWKIEEAAAKLEYKEVTKDIKITSSLHQNASAIGTPNKVINELILTLSHLFDLQRDIKMNDKLTVTYQHANASSLSHLFTHLPTPQKVTYLQYQQQKQIHTMYRFKDAFYYGDGRAVQSGLLKTPIKGARLSSHFGNRKHPILGYSRLHKGIDFGAPIGTPIFAAGDGKVVRAKRYGSFGNCVIIKHNNGYQTLYAHLQGFAAGINKDTKVKQGEIIGYLGNTGLSGARHLHYEIHKNGKAINPLTLKSVPGESLQGKTLVAFQRKINQMQEVFSQVQKDSSNNVAE